MEIYNKSREVSRLAWPLYVEFDWNTKKIIGDQWIEAIDSIGANIAEGNGRYHYADRNKFNYNARGSLVEAKHWTALLAERSIIPSGATSDIQGRLQDLLISLNAVIKSTKEHAGR
ncbi:MAG: four helix bundle protein [Candidatus Yanofskybacteria bacterium]|nr:four helix bundle protein [Candidatus Yanofskybacteria bacterium]